MERVRELALICSSSPFQEITVIFLEDCEVLASKIASFENHYLPFLEKATATGRSLIISTGIPHLDELEQS